MTYTESNRSFVSSILKPYFREAGIEVKDDTLEKIVDSICRNNNITNINAADGHDLVLQQGLNLLKKSRIENR